MITDKELRELIRQWLDRGTVTIDGEAVKTSVASLERLSGFLGVAPYLSGKNHSVSLANYHKLRPILEPK